MKKFVVLLLLIPFGCQTTNNEMSPTLVNVSDEHFVSPEKAASIAQMPVKSTPNARQTGSDGKSKKIKSQLVIDDADDKTKKTATLPVFYIFNYEEGGYSIISADNRLDPVLAVVEEGEGIEKSSELPGGLLLWMQSTKEQVQAIRKAKLSKKEAKGARKSHVDNFVISEVNPLLRTRWGQGCGFNANVPACGSGPCGRAQAGCVAISMAQIMRYWGTVNPNFRTQFLYDWSAMPVGTSPTSGGDFATSEIARLVFDAGREIGTSYGCDASGANRNDVVPGLKNRFGFSSANFRYYRPYDVAQSLDRGRPVILAGCTDSGNFLGWEWGKGACHAWVSDGYRLHEVEDNEYCYYDEYGYYNCYTPVVRYYQLHMNWGWGGAHNGWFSGTYFGADENNQPMPFDFKSHQDEIVDIHP